LEKNRVSHREKRRLVRREAFTEFRLPLLSASERSACLIRHNGVAAAIGELPRLEGMADAGRGLKTLDCNDTTVLHTRLLNIHIQEKREVCLRETFFEKDRAALGVVIEAAIDGFRTQGAPEFIHNPAFPRIGIMSRKGSTSYALADFAGSISTENGTVLDERDLETAPGCGQRSAQAGDAASHDAEIKAMGLCDFPKPTVLGFGEIDRGWIHGSLGLLHRNCRQFEAEQIEGLKV